MRIRASARVEKVRRWTYPTFSTLLNASLTVLSKHEPTRPMDSVTPRKMTPWTSPPRVAAAMCRAATTSSAS